MPWPATAISDRIYEINALAPHRRRQNYSWLIVELASPVAHGACHVRGAHQPMARRDLFLGYPFFLLYCELFPRLA